MSLMDAWTAKDRRVAIWSVLGTFFFGVLYAPTLVAAFVSAGNVKDPLTDPFLEILEVQSILMAPPMVVTMVAVHGYAPRDAKMYSLSALGFMILCAGVTTSVHFVELTVARRIDPASMPGYSQLFSPPGSGPPCFTRWTYWPGIGSLVSACSWPLPYLAPLTAVSSNPSLRRLFLVFPAPAATLEEPLHALLDPVQPIVDPFPVFPPDRAPWVLRRGLRDPRSDADRAARADP